MKRVDLIRHIEASGCAFLREGGRHTVYVNSTARKVSTVPRHREINDFMAKKICRELEIDEPGKEKKPAKGEQSDAADSRWNPAEWFAQGREPLIGVVQQMGVRIMADTEMKDLKAAVLELVNDLPSDATWEDVMYRVYVREAIEAGRRDAAEGRLVDLAEVRRRFGLAE